MRNFARLVRFTWPYRLQFVLSIGCAMVVASLWFTELGAVLPLLKILFNGENAQDWIIEGIESNETKIAVLEARLKELDLVPNLMPEPKRRNPALMDHVARIRAERDAAEDAYQRKLRELKGAETPISVGTAGRLKGAVPEADRAEYNALNRAYLVAEAREDELSRAVGFINEDDQARLIRRRADYEKELAGHTLWLGRYQWLRPRIAQFLPQDAFRSLVVLMIAVMIGVAIKGLFMFLQEFLVARIMNLTIFDIRNLFFRRTMALDLGSFNDQGSADLLARFTNDMDSVSQGLVVLLSKVIREPLRIIACLGGALWLNWRLTLLALVLVPVSVYTTVKVGKTMKRAIRRSLESMSTIYKILQETFQGIKVVKGFTMERHERRRFFLECKALYKKRTRVATIEAMSDPVLEMLALTTVTIALLAGSFLVLRGVTYVDLGFMKLQLASEPILIEDLLTLYAMLAGVSDPIRKLATVHSKIQRAAAASDRICALMDREPRVVEKADAERLPRHHRSIEFDQVNFSYNGRDPILRGIDLTVHHGETIALVGPNGCGKSTLLSLLPRFYDPQTGAIRIDGVDIRDVEIRSLRRQVGLVTQETILFEDTIANNIAYGTPHASRERIEAAARQAYAHQFIQNLPEGYDTVLAERGMSLSGGQRQRLALARAILRDPAILILDEATSAVDIQDEALIRKAIEEFSRGRTTFLITHNLGSLQFADRIVLIHNGRVEGVGTDEELRKTSPLYRKLNEIQYQRAAG
jgi:ABC-type multidrug transport system fused ATPase/permease subunit